VPWIIKVGKDGKFLGCIENRYQKIIPPKTPKSKPKTIILSKYRWVPREPERTSGDYAFFLCDNTEYLFGMEAPAKKGAKRPEEKLENRRKLFREKIIHCYEETGDEAIGAVLNLLDKVRNAEEEVMIHEECGGSDLITFQYSPDIDLLVCDRPKVREYWKKHREEKISETPIVRCLVTGKKDHSIDKHQMLKKVPGGTTSGVALVSYNSKAFESYDLIGNENAPISFEASEKCSVALNRLLNPDYPNPEDPEEALPSRRYVLSSDTVVCFWGSNPCSNDFLDVFPNLMEADPVKVKDLYQCIWKGELPPDIEPSDFYALTLTGTQGRAVVRDWFESNLPDVMKNLSQYFNDLSIVRNTPKPKKGELTPQLPLTVLLRSLAPLGRSDDIPPHIASQMVRSALSGTRYPMTVLHRALERMRAEIADDEWSGLLKRDARAALIKAVLNRNKMIDKEVTREMDPKNTNPGYLLGRLLAVIERAQQIALGDINATVIDRYFGGATAAPGAVFPRLLKNMRHHVKKARDEGKYRGTALWLEKQTDDILSSLNQFPGYLPVEQQGLFILGYHHQRHFLWQKKEKQSESEE